MSASPSPSPSPKIVASDPQAWRSAFLNLRPSASPCPGLHGPKWQATHEKALEFLDRHADEAAALGWTTLDLFGVHPVAGVYRPDFCGALVMSEDKVSSLTATRMAFVNTAFYRDTPGRPAGAVPIWAFHV